MHCDCCCGLPGHCIGGVRVYGSAAPAQERSVDAVKEAHGFTLARQEFVKEYNSEVLVYKHNKSGDLHVGCSVHCRVPISVSVGGC